MLSGISPVEALQKMRRGEIRIVDIREPDEVNSVRIPGAEVAPLSMIQWANMRPATEKKPIVFICHTANRTHANCDVLEKAAGGPAMQVEGGIRAWINNGLPVERGDHTLTMFRQIQIGAGSVVLLGLLAGLIWPCWLWLSALAGASLIFAGATGICALGSLLSAMPWNNK